MGPPLLSRGPRAPSYRNSRLLGYVAIGYIEPRYQYLGDWSPRGCMKVIVRCMTVYTLVVQLLSRWFSHTANAYRLRARG